MPDLCKHVTGHAFEPHYWTLAPERQGSRRMKPEVQPAVRGGRVLTERPEAVYDVLCGGWAHWQVTLPSGRVLYVCNRDLAAAIEKDGGRAQVEALDDHA